MKTRISRRYLAGLIDGEGYISIKPDNQKNRARFSPVIKMALTEKTAYILFEIKDLLGGYIYKRVFSNKRYNCAYCWEVHNFIMVKNVLEYVYPYLILKKEQAKLVLSLIKTKIPVQKTKEGKFIPLDKDIVKKRQSLFNLVKKLNKRGCSPAETECETPVLPDEATVRTDKKLSEIDGTETLIPHHNIN